MFVGQLWEILGVQILSWFFYISYSYVCSNKNNIIIANEV